VWDLITTGSVGPVWDDGEFFSAGASYNGTGVFLYFENGTNVKAFVTKDFRFINEFTVAAHGVGQFSGWPLIHDGAVFITAQYEAAPGFEAKVHTSADGQTWTTYTLDADTARNGGKTLQRVGGALVLPAYNDANNSMYTSGDNGATWSRVGLPATSPLYKPIVSASNGSVMVWVGEAVDEFRIYDGTTWADCTILTGVIGSGQDKKIEWCGTRFIIFDGTNAYYISLEDDPSTFERYTSPFTGTPDTLMGGNGVIAVSYEHRLYTATEEEAIAGNWVERSWDSDNGANTYPTASAFDGQAHAVAGVNDPTSASVRIQVSKPVQL
jgi:hypothetical protein